MTKRIKILPGGPYEVDSDIPLHRAKIVTDEKGDSKEWKIEGEYPDKPTEPYHLCRCGRSKNKPFCDGTHKETKFEVKERASRTPFIKQAKLYEGETLNLLDNEFLCASLRYCHERGGTWRNAVFSSSDENRDSAINSACNCASGRLVVTDKEGNPIEKDYEAEVDLIQDTKNDIKGPLWIKGDIQLIGQDGYEYEKRNRMTLCRCGQSTNMPYCDRHHLTCDHMKGLDEEK
ncbi:MAG: CDGSH iron-sulfur domain-containing protein [Lachnospiraceae bacterium]|jgi:CDGSH-type Zn-finger protein|nr:CDGSH iron-sulfur domain-containing protein [Lachnospiraceae bacterium]